MTADELRAAITRDCPHRLVDFDGHLAGRPATDAFIRLWRIEHAISSRPAIEAELGRLHGLAEDCPDYAGAKNHLEQVSRIRREITEGLR